MLGITSLRSLRVAVHICSPLPQGAHQLPKFTYLFPRHRSPGASNCHYHKHASRKLSLPPVQELLWAAVLPGPGYSTAWGKKAISFLVSTAAHTNQRRCSLFKETALSEKSETQEAGSGPKPLPPLTHVPRGSSRAPQSLGGSFPP